MLLGPICAVPGPGIVRGGTNCCGRCLRAGDAAKKNNHLSRFVVGDAAKVASRWQCGRVLLRPSTAIESPGVVDRKTARALAGKTTEENDYAVRCVISNMRRVASDRLRARRKLPTG